ncbi:hypothetical protein D9758_008847 [Tetrapyrgos nigripes]|uniref:Uncharacterized protein n=1 Tax=Tetrapyrgos nigripes TaxID=182062 RepID=A0A8H5FNV2_9AGAR|nr:hypothetical protein D9758_008847 [Tetrapyrgos nigripes]
MLSCRGTVRRSLRPIPVPHHSRYPQNRRHLSGIIENAGQGFLDLATALPYPPSFPPYSTTIILVTIFSRLITIPATYWASKRAQRYEENVLSALSGLRPIIAEQEFRAMQQERIRGEKDYLKRVHAERCQAILTARGKELAKQHRCRPLFTSLISPLAQAPVFVFVSMMFSHLARNPASCFDSESFLTLTTLVHPDETFTLPIVLGLLTMANVEASTWVMTPAERAKLAENEAKLREQTQNDGIRRYRPQSMIKSALRGLSVVRVGLCAIAPGAVTVYWVASATLGLLQTWVTNWLDARRRRAFQATSPSVPITSSSPPPAGSAAAMSNIKAQNGASNQGKPSSWQRK